MTIDSPTGRRRAEFHIRLVAARLAASGLWPAGWMKPQPPPRNARTARRGRLHIELVSHCWQYSHLLAYQLSALVLHPPRDADVTVTVFFSDEDVATRALLAAFEPRRVANVRWNFQTLPPTRLFRRSIGRNLAARATTADWIWFTDCDLVCHAGCIDGLAEALQGRQDALVHPRREHITPLLDADAAMLQSAAADRLMAIDPARFATRTLSRATGPMQITHGDVARACGYCAALPVYQQPMPHFAKCHEDRAFRWLLGTRGTPIDVPAIYRIRHQVKGRYQGDRSGAVRRWIRRWQERLQPRAD